MNSNRSSGSAVDVIGRFLFPGVRRSRRRTNLRYLMLSLVLGLMVCGALVGLLILVNR